MNCQDEKTQNLLEVIPDILLWIDNEGRLVDYHPNNHAFLFDRKGGVIGCHLEEIFDRELSIRMMELAEISREQHKVQSGRLSCCLDGSVSDFECRIAPLERGGYIAGCREIMSLPESRKGELIKGANQATLTLLTEPSLEDAICKAFGILGPVFRADRIALFKNHEDPESRVFMTLLHEWSHTDVPHSLNSRLLSQIPYHPELSDLYDTLKAASPVIALTEDLRPPARTFFSLMDLLSVVILPVMVRNRFRGFLILGDCRHPRVWKEEDVRAITTLSVILGTVIQKHQDQEELTLARLRAEESDRLKSSILANINHELRTPMTGILGFSELLHQKLDDEEARQMAKNIQISGTRLLATLNSMIELSQFESKKILYRLRETKLNELILIACEPHLSQAKQKKLGFEIYMNESIFSFIDEKLFTQLLDHILENAVKFTHKGKISVETRNEWEGEKSWSCISVTDTGPGIPEEFHELIFEEFRQVSEGYNRSFEGSGLGLTLAKKMVELMNGKITLMSREGQGCTFTIYLPSSQLCTPDLKPPEAISPDFPETIDFPSPASTEVLPSVLVVEDNKLNTDLIRIYLLNLCRCDVAWNGELAVDMAKSKTYDAILMDINLGPGIDGLEVTRQIRSLPRYSRTPIVAITGYTLDTDREEIMTSGCTHYLPKPVDKKEFITLITSLVGRK